MKFFMCDHHIRMVPEEYRRIILSDLRTLGRISTANRDYAAIAIRTVRGKEGI